MFVFNFIFRVSRTWSSNTSHRRDESRGVRERGGEGKGSRAHVATINLHSDVIGEEQVTEQEDSLSGRGGRQ